MREQLDEAKRLLLINDAGSAVRIYKKILKLDPKNIEALHGMSLACFQQKKYGEAENCLIKAISFQKNNPELHLSLAIVYIHQDSLDKAAKSLETAKKNLEKIPGCSDDPKYVKILNMLATVYIRQQNFIEAKPLLKKALEKDPKNIDTLKMLAQSYVGLLQYHHAIETIEKLPLEESVLEALKVEIYLLKTDYRNALKSAKRCVELNPENTLYLFLLGESYIRCQELEKSLETFKKGLALDPCHFKILGRVLALQVRICEWREREDIIARLRSLAAADKTGECLAAIQPAIAILAGFTNREIKEIAQAHCRKIEKTADPIREHLHFTFKPAKKKKIKIGYLSSDYYNHATAHLMLDVFGLHDRAKFEVFAYSYGKDDKSRYRKIIKEGCDHFIDIGRMSDTKAAEKIHSDGIDILVDLKGHIVDHRLGILALRPSPVQIHYLGYPGTIGATFIDYLVADPYVIPKSERKYYTESIAYLPITYQANTAQKIIQKKIQEKSEYGIPEDAFVFCCFNQNDKYDTNTVNIWMKILKSVPNSVMWFWGNYDKLKQKLDDYGKEHGIEPKRFIVSDTEPSHKHLSRMRLANLFLDTFNYSAHTSCSDAIRVGLPVLTLPGKTFASRVAGNLLRQVKVPELIARSPEEYLSKAIELANNPVKLKRIQEKINKNREASHLYDSPLFTAHLEEAYSKMWKRYLSGMEPKDIIVPR